MNILKNGQVATRRYPVEARRIGKLTDEDRRNGQYDLHDEVEVTVGGHGLHGGISGHKSCAGKFEGRYASEGGTMGMLTVVVKNGKATVRTPDVVGSPDKGMTAAQSENEAERRTDGKKIVLRWLDKSNFDFSIDVNADGMLDTPFGELRRKSR